MRLTQRAVVLVTAAVASVALAATATAAAASPSPAGSTARAVTSVTKVIRTIPVGLGPGFVATNPLTNTIYVTNNFFTTVSVINGRTKKVVATIPVGPEPSTAAAIR